MLIQRYLTRDVLVHAGAVTLVLFLVVFSGRFINYLAEAAIGDISPTINSLLAANRPSPISEPISVA